MAVREYVGARYVPVFADPAEWSSERAYEPLTIVTYAGNSYTSKKPVPVGTLINNTDYWLQTGNFNAQVEAYRQEVVAYSQTVSDLEETVGDATEGLVKDVNNLKITVGNSATGLVKDVDELQDTVGDSAMGLVKDVNDNTSDIYDLGLRVTALENEVEEPAVPIMLVVGDSWMNFVDHLDWVSPVCDALGCEMKNYALGGTGWSYRAPSDWEQGNFSEQIEHAYADMTADEISRVKWIVCVGGVNDFTQSNYSCDDFKTYVASGVTAFKSACNNRFPNALVYASLNVPYYTWNNNQSAKVFYLTKWMETNMYPGGVKPIIPIRNLNWFLWVVTSGYDSAGLHPSSASVAGMADCLLATIQGGGADACIASDSFTINATDTSVNVVFGFQNGVLTIYPAAVQGDEADDEVYIPSSGWGPLGNIMRIQARRVYNCCFTSNGSFAGWVSLVSGTNAKFTIFKTSTSSYPGYPGGVFTIDYNFACDSKG